MIKLGIVEPFAKITIKTSPRIRSIFRIHEQFNYYFSIYILWAHIGRLSNRAHNWCIWNYMYWTKKKNNRTETGSRRWRLFKSRLLASVHKTSAVFSEFSLLRLQLSSLSLCHSFSIFCTCVRQYTLNTHILSSLFYLAHVFGCWCFAKHTKRSGWGCLC